MHAYRRFCNKIWQASKYVLGKLPEDFVPAASLDLSKLSTPEKWILYRMNSAVKGVNQALTAREFSKTTQVMYQFFYDELCDVFIENSKAILIDGSPEEKSSVQQTLYHLLDVALRLLHPITPFITEELWQRLPRRKDEAAESIMLATYPEHDGALDFESEAREYETGLKCAEGIRSLGTEYGVRTAGNGHAYVRTSTADSFRIATEQAPAIKALAGRGIDTVDILDPKAEVPKGCAVYAISSEVVVLLDVASTIKDVGQEIAKVQAKLKKSQMAATKQKELLGREGFEDKVSEALVAEEKKKLADTLAAIGNYEATIAQFEKLKVGE